VCIGDRYRIGEAEFEVTQPRVTCYRVGLRLGEPQMAALLVAHHRPGFYMRVITEGHIQAGDPCGPGPFMAGMLQALTALGIGQDRVHTELFGALAAITPGLTRQVTRAPHQPPGPVGTGPLVTFARSGITVRYPAGTHSVLDLADACDVPTRWSCRTGVCHTCVTPLLSGDVSYAPDPLEPPPGGQVLICCARPGSDIVLDM
jgi:ferredoxin